MVWQIRKAKRHTAVQAIVARRGVEALRLAPDPEDRNVNKRAWEHLMMVFSVGLDVCHRRGWTFERSVQPRTAIACFDCMLTYRLR